ncbi:ATP-binding cassette domain-containing protein [Enterococcus sp. LJL128]|uniref:ATP-binding cassette domain-containing protein n=1 Tax=Enterococcus sp. LJL51 TaxID=3416656 RepID=UPI003CF8F22B
MEIVKMTEVSYQLAEKAEALFERITIQLESGSVYLILSDSGIEKSGFAAVLAGLEKPTSGELRYHSLLLNDGELAVDQIGTVFQQDNFIPEFSPLENIYYYQQIIKQPKRKKECLSYLAAFGIDKKSAGIPLVKSSLFIQKKYCLAKAMACRPKLLVLDHLFSGVGFPRQECLMDYLRTQADEEDVCIVILTEEQFLGKYADEVWGLNRGRLSFIKSR